MFIIPPEDAEKFIDDLSIDKFYGIGKVTAEKMHRLGIHRGSDLKKPDLPTLVRNFGKTGEFFYKIARGIDERPVEPDQERKSIGTEFTFDRDLTTRFAVIAELYKIEKELMSRLDESEASGRTVTLKIKFSDFRQITRSRTLQTYIRDFDTLHRTVTGIRRSIDLTGTRIRLMGVSVSNLETEDTGERQLEFLF